MKPIAILICQVVIILIYVIGVIYNILQILATSGEDKQLYWVVKLVVVKPIWLAVLIWAGVFNF